MTTIYIVRHAHKELGEYYNPRLRHQDEPVSQQGREQAHRLASYLCEKDISAIYISAYWRTAQTIDPLARQLSQTPIVDERLNEIDNGRIEGMSDEAIQLTYPDVWRGFRERSHDFGFPDGETGEEACQRIAAFLEEKRQTHQGEKIVAVSHEGLIRVLMCHLMDLPVYRRWDFHYDFAGVTEIVYQPDYERWKLVRFNHVIV